MSTVWQNIEFLVAFAFHSIAISFRVLRLFFFGAFYYAIGNDPKLKLAFPSLASLCLETRHASANAASGIRKDETAASRLARHPYIPPQPGYRRSPCPALNTMANHGYIPRDGTNLNGTNLTRGLVECYNLSWPLAAFLSWGGVLLLGQVGPFSLHDLARHNRIEHDASITHHDTPKTTPSPSSSPFSADKQPKPSAGKTEPGASSDTETSESVLLSSRSSSGFSARSMHTSLAEDDWLLHVYGDTEYAPCANDPELFASFLADARDGHFTARDIARARVRRESAPTSRLTAVQQEIARGEVALVLQIFCDVPRDRLRPEEYTVSVDKICPFWTDEKLPEGWKPVRQTTLLGTVNVSKAIRMAMFELRSKNAAAAAGREKSLRSQ